MAEVTAAIRCQALALIAFSYIMAPSYGATTLCTCGTSACLYADQAQTTESLPQAKFGAEIEIVRPVNVPNDVLMDLQKDKQVLACVTGGQSSSVVTGLWFAASEISLNDDKLADLVIMPKNRCLLGANVSLFWVYRNTSKGYQRVLHTSGLVLEIRKEKTNGYRDIRASAVVESNFVSHLVFKFDKNKYRLHQTSRD